MPSYNHTWLADDQHPTAAGPAYADALATYVSETNKTANAWTRVVDDLLEFKRHTESNSIRDVFAHQILSERRFFAEFLGLDEVPAVELLPAGHEAKTATAASYVDRYVELAAGRLPALAAGNADWWQGTSSFFEVPRSRFWVLLRRMFHTAHHRTQVLVDLRLAGSKVPATYGPSGDETWDGADPTETVEAAG